MKKKIKIDGMSCKHCVARVENALKENGIVGAEVEIGTAIAEFGNFTEADIKDMIESLGFDVLEISAV